MVTRIKAWLLNPTLRQQYLNFVIWGLIYGAMVAGTFAAMAPSLKIDDLYFFVEIIIISGIVHAIVFGVLLKAPRWAQTLGFLIIGIALPYIVFTVVSSVEHWHFELYSDPIGIVVTVVWTLYTLLFAIIAMVAYIVLHAKH